MSETDREKKTTPKRPGRRTWLTRLAATGNTRLPILYPVLSRGAPVVTGQRLIHSSDFFSVADYVTVLALLTGAATLNSPLASSAGIRSCPQQKPRHSRLLAAQDDWQRQSAFELAMRRATVVLPAAVGWAA